MSDQIVKNGKLVDAALDDYITTLSTTPPESGRFYLPYKWMQAILLELRQRRDVEASKPVTGDAAQAALGKINHIRNSIVGMQTINWSEHIYPLVAALDEAGMVGMEYPEGREYFGTLLERTNKAESEIAALREKLDAARLEGVHLGLLAAFRVWTDKWPLTKPEFREMIRALDPSSIAVQKDGKEI